MCTFSNYWVASKVSFLPITHLIISFKCRVVVPIRSYKVFGHCFRPWLPTRQPYAQHPCQDSPPGLSSLPRQDSCHEPAVEACRAGCGYGPPPAALLPTGQSQRGSIVSLTYAPPPAFPQDPTPAPGLFAVLAAPSSSAASQRFKPFRFIGHRFFVHWTKPTQASSGTRTLRGYP